MSDAPDNGRVTLAILGQKIDEVLRRLDRLERILCDHDSRLVRLEIGQSERATQIHDMRQDISALEKKSESWSVINSIGVAVAALMAAIGITK